MKRALLAFGTALTVSGVLTGCDLNNAANDPRSPRDVTYRTDDRFTDRDNRQNLTDRDNRQNLTNRENPDTVRDNRDNRNGFQDNRTDRALAKRIADRANKVEGVDRSHVVATANRVLVGIDPKNGRAENANLDEEVRSAVQPMAGNRDVYVSSDINLVRRIADVEADINANAGGEGAREVRSDILGIIDDLTNAIRRPFENNTR
ncbi:sporulation protein [Sporolactobacillus sp. THM7-7]|nr:sporulation protein [Sporolactobacillus sp. THM7-7]